MLLLNVYISVLSLEAWIFPGTKLHSTLCTSVCVNYTLIELRESFAAGLRPYRLTRYNRLTSRWATRDIADRFRDNHKAYTNSMTFDANFWRENQHQWSRTVWPSVKLIRRGFLYTVELSRRASRPIGLLLRLRWAWKSPLYEAQRSFCKCKLSSSRKQLNKIVKQAPYTNVRRNGLQTIGLNWIIVFWTIFIIFFKKRAFLSSFEISSLFDIRLYKIIKKYYHIRADTSVYTSELENVRLPKTSKKNKPRHLRKETDNMIEYDLLRTTGIW
jgi:hypothetical protein